MTLSLKVPNELNRFPIKRHCFLVGLFFSYIIIQNVNLWRRRKQSETYYYVMGFVCAVSVSVCLFCFEGDGMLQLLIFP